MQETQVQPLGWEDPLEEGMANHISILARRTAWTEEPWGLQFMGLQRVGQDRVANRYTQYLLQKISFHLYTDFLVSA